MKFIVGSFVIYLVVSNRFNEYYSLATVDNETTNSSSSVADKAAMGVAGFIEDTLNPANAIKRGLAGLGSIFGL